MTIGVFDSGLGGLTIVATMRSLLRGAQIIYIADTANAPYGEKTKDQILDYSIRITDYLVEHHRIDALVVACNTATSAAITELREKYPNLIIVGTEPGLKPAISHSVTKKVGVLATPATLEGEKYKALVAMLSNHYHVEVFEQPCPGLVQQIEAGKTDTQETLSMLEGWLSPMRSANVDTIVLGCTHYPLVKESIAKVMGHPIIFVDSAEGVTKRLLFLLEQKGHINRGSISLEILATGNIQSEMIERILGEKFSVTMLNSI
ncbi:MAG: glutamate racemase [Sulfuricurvum sp.]|jgi:glutamate racemase|uniref:glutamate racemase n=1 Tax=Sulfuricurvum sp. TaxID=2025608 RepID=UPI0025EB7383|nr:glutamate racemase [Sulfuricurvum sp.]MCI4405757.1 glutamate racemase [Sulfuricurvum sp.]